MGCGASTQTFGSKTEEKAKPLSDNAEASKTAEEAKPPKPLSDDAEPQHSADASTASSAAEDVSSPESIESPPESPAESPAAVESVKAAPAEASAEPCVVVDCGSGHSKVYVYRWVGEDILEKATRLKRVLTDALVAGEAAAFLEDVAQHVPAGARVLLGATGGVRRALETGKVGEEAWREFTAALAARWEGASAVVLTGTEEATRELVAVRTLKQKMDARMAAGSQTFVEAAETAPTAIDAATVGLLSGGGESCQIAWGAGPSPRVECVRLSTVEAATRIEENEAEGWAWWNEHLASVKQQVTDWPQQGLDGTFVGTALQGTVASHCGFDGRYVPRGDLVEAVAKLIEELQAEEESERVVAQREAFEVWALKVGADQPWLVRKRIHLLAAMRLHRLAQDLFSPDAVFFFARKFEIVKGHKLDAEWTLGSFLAM